MRFHRPSLRSTITVATVLFVLVACQNATGPNSSSDGAVVATSQLNILSPARVPDNADWRLPGDSAVVQKPVCVPIGSTDTTTCTETYDLSKPLHSDTLTLELWTLGIRTATLRYTESGSSTTLDLLTKFTAFDALDTLLLYRYASLTPAQKSSISALGKGVPGVVAYYASLVLSGDASVAGKPLPVGMSIDSVKKDLVYLGLEGGVTVAQLTSLNVTASLTLDATTVHLLAGLLVQSKVLNASDTLDWLHPVRLLIPVSATGGLTAGGNPDSVGGAFSWDKGSVITISPRIGTTKPGDSVNFQFPLEHFPQASDTGWSASGNLTVLALSAASAGTDTLMVTVSDNAGHSAQSWTLLQVAPAVMADTTTPTISLKTTKVDSSARTAIVQAIANSTSGIDSIVSRAGTPSRKKLGVSLLDTIFLSPGFNLLTDSVYARNGKQAGASDTISLPKASNSVPPVVALLVPVKSPDTVSWSTKNIQLSWSITETTYGTSSAMLDGNAVTAPSTGTNWSAAPGLAVGTNTFRLLVQNTNGDTTSSILTVVRQPDTLHPAVSWQGSLASGDTLPFKTPSYVATWKVTDADTVSSVVANGNPLVGTAQGSGVYLYSATLHLPKASKGYDTTLFVLATGGSAADTARNTVLIHVSADTSHPVIIGADSAVVPFGSMGYRFSGTVSDSDTVAILTANATANGQAATANFVRTGNTWTDTVSLASSPVVVTIVATDSAGNSTTRTMTIRVAPQSGDHIPPVVVRSAPTAKLDTVAWDISTVHLSWAITDNVGVGTVTDNGKALTGSGGVWTDLGALTMGLNTFVLKATDTSGNASYDTVSVFRAADLTAPAAVRATGTNDAVVPSSASSFTASWTVTDNAIQTVTINGSQVTGSANVYSKAVTLTGDSTNIALVATDSSGNTTRDAITVKRLTPANITGAGNSLSGSVTATMSANLSGAVLSYSTDGVHWTSYPSGGIAVTTSEILYAKDSAGWTTQIDSAIYLFAPVITPVSGAYTAAQTVSIKDSGATIKYYLGYTQPSTLNSYAVPISINACTVLHAVATLGGATSSAAATYAFPPSVSPYSGTYADKKSVSVVAAESDSVQDSIAGANWTTISSPFAVTKSGTYYFRSAINGIYSTSSTGMFTITHDTSLSEVMVGGSSYSIAAVNKGTFWSMLQDSLPFGTTSVTVTAVPNDTAARVTINGGTSGVVTLINDTATVQMKVVNGSSAQTYSLNLFSKMSGSFTDARDGQVYNAVKIGAQTWMAQNLGWAGSTGSLGVCYGNSSDSCLKYGRLYTWSQTDGLADSCDSVSCASQVATVQRGICPSGWHLPTEAEWLALGTAVNQDASGLKSTTWGGTNSWGFSANGGGAYNQGAFAESTLRSYFWTSGEWTATQGVYGYLEASDSLFNYISYSKLAALSVRCVMN